MATNKEMQQEFDIFADIWNLFKKYYHVTDSEQFWDSLVEESRALIDKYDNELCMELTQTIINELERKFKKQQ